jgi:Flp pilus assembly pilin Flp
MMPRSVAFPHLAQREEGQTMAEYAITLGALVLVVISVIGVLSTSVVNRFGIVATTIKGLVP